MEKLNTRKLLKLLDDYTDYLVWSIAAVSMLGSLYFSQVLNWYPCLLCWWQRIFMYPLVAIFAVGILKKDKNAAYYGLPLSLIGLLISLYQSLLQWGVIHESVISCTASSDVSCAKPQIDWLGFKMCRQCHT